MFVTANWYLMRRPESQKAAVCGRRLGVASGKQKLRYHADMRETPIAERHLVFSEKGKSERKPLVIRVFAPRVVDPASVSFQVAPGTAVCAIEFDGIPDETLGDTFGAD